jgi:N-acetylglutamate synthase-like GNAT family acetyltransferase
VWVDPQARQRGVGAALVGRATLDCTVLGVGPVYLCVRPERSGFNERLGLIPIEWDVGERDPSVFIRDAIPETKINRSPP